MKNRLIKILIIGSTIIAGMCACGTKKKVNVTFPSKEQNSVSKENENIEVTKDDFDESMTNVRTETIIDVTTNGEVEISTICTEDGNEYTTEVQSEDKNVSNSLTMNDIMLKKFHSVEDVVETYIEALENTDWDTVVSLRAHYVVDTFLLSGEQLSQEDEEIVGNFTSEEYMKKIVDSNSKGDGLYKVYINEKRTDLVGSTYSWNKDYNLTYEEINKDLSEALFMNLESAILTQEEVEFVQTCQVKIVVESPVFYSEEADYYDSVLSLCMIQDAGGAWYLLNVELEGNVKEYDDISTWNEIESYQKEWLPVLTQFIEGENNGVKGWNIDSAYVKTATQVQDTATNIGQNISHIFDFYIKLEMENGTFEYKTVTIMCSNGQWSILN